MIPVPVLIAVPAALLALASVVIVRIIRPARHTRPDCGLCDRGDLRADCTCEQGCGAWACWRYWV